MRWLRRIALALAILVALAAVGAGVLWWRLRQEPEELAGTPAMNAAEAERVLREMGQPGADTPEDTRIYPRWPPRKDQRKSSGAVGRRPYRIMLGERQVAALVVSQVTRVAGGQVGDVRVAVRERDLFAAARLRGTALAGSFLSITAVPAAGRGGRLCLRLGEPHVGGQRIPAEVVEQLGGEDAYVPRTICMSPRAVGLPGPVQSARVAAGGVVVEGIR